MRYRSTYKHPENLNFIIDEDLPAGFYIYIYEEPDMFYEDLKDSRGLCTHHQDANLQDDLETAKFDAFYKFGVPEDSWVEIDDRQP